MSIAPPPGEIEAMIAQSLGGLLSRIHSIGRVRTLRSSTTAFDRDLWSALAGEGWLGLGAPEEAGGGGLPLQCVCVAVERFAAELVPEPFVACVVVPTAILRACNSARAANLLRQLVSGERVVTLAWQEQLAPGNMLAAPHVSLAGGLLSGRKHLVPAGMAADTLLVTASLEGELIVVAIPAHTPGTIRNPVRLSDGTLAADVEFIEVAVAPEAVVAEGDQARCALAAAYGEGLVAAAASSLASARRLFGMTVDYTSARRQFGRPVASFQAVQHQLVDWHTRMELAASLLRDALAQQGAGPGAASAAKSACGDAAMLGARCAIQLHGAIGYADEADVGLYVKAVLRDAGLLGSPDQHAARFLATIDADR